MSALRKRDTIDEMSARRKCGDGSDTEIYGQARDVHGRLIIHSLCESCPLFGPRLPGDLGDSFATRWATFPSHLLRAPSALGSDLPLTSESALHSRPLLPSTTPLTYSTTGFS